MKFEILTGVWVYGTELEAGGYSFELTNTNQEDLKFQIDFSGCKNMKIDGEQGMTLGVRVDGGKTVAIPNLVIRDSTRGSSFSMGCVPGSIETIEPDPAELQRAAEADQRAVEERIAAQEASKVDAESLSLQQVAEKFADREESFIDGAFPPLQTSIGDYQCTSQQGTVVPVSWRRPSEFFQGDFDVFTGGIEFGDIIQGELGCCWFLCAVSAISEYPALVKQLFPWYESDSALLDKCKRAGVYEVRFCKGGAWRSLRLDDYFPCRPGGGPVFAHAHGNELWAMLLEKGFAKLHGTYTSLRGGWAYEALMDLTGAPAFSLSFTDEAVKAKIDSGALWKELTSYDDRGYLMSASTPGEDKFTDNGVRPGREDKGPGLTPGHAYALIAAKELSNGDCVVLIHNPWTSDYEWTGKYCDDWEGWTDQLKQEVSKFGPSSKGDGKFWMEWSDVLHYFDGVNVCCVRASDAGTGWHEHRSRGDFTFDAKRNAVLTDNHYAITVPAGGVELWAGVHQTDSRVLGARAYIDIGVSVLRRARDGYELVASSGCQVDRQAQCNAERLPAGEYLVVPVSTGCRFRSVQQESPRPRPLAATAEERKEAEARGERAVLCKDAVRAISEVFDRLDKDMDGVLSRNELDRFARVSEGRALDDRVFRWITRKFDTTPDGSLTREGFRHLYEHLYERNDSRDDVIMRDFTFMGYNHDLQAARARVFTLTLHSSSPVRMEAVRATPQATDAALDLAVKTLGKHAGAMQQGGKDVMVLLNHSAGRWGSSYAMENRMDVDMKITVDCTGSSNVMSHRDTLKHTTVVKAGQTEVFHHLVPVDQGAGGWGVSVSFSAEQA